MADSSGIVWTAARLDRALRLLRAEREVSGALERVAARLSAEPGPRVTATALRFALQRHTGAKVGAVVGTAQAPVAPTSDGGAPPLEQAPATAPREVDPVAEHRERSAADRAARERRELLERVSVAEERVRILDGISAPLQPPVIRARERASGLREATAVALASDWHVEETVDPEQVDGRNAFNLEVADRRVRRFFEGVGWLVGYHRQAFVVRDLVLWLGGDLLSGYIHEELAEGNALSPTETVMWLRQRLRDGIATLLADRGLERVIVPCSYGNHGRTTERKRVATGAENSYEWLLYHVLASDFAVEPRVRFTVPRGEHVYVEAYGRTLHFTHGDSVSYGGGVGGISIPLNKACSAWDTVRRADYHHIGHFHQRLEGRNWSANGSLIGYSPYAWHVKAHYEPPQQSFYLLDSRRGRCQSTPIWLDDDDEAAVA